MRLVPSELDQLKNVIRQVSQSQVQRHYRHLDCGDVATKRSSIDLVTVADRNIEQQLTRELTRLYPQAVVIGEEAVSAAPHILERLGDADLAFVIDPIDGTWNFANEISVFGVMVAVISNGQTQHGLLYDPLQDDWVMATQGQGAWRVDSTGQSQVLNASDRDVLAQAIGFVSLFTFNAAMQLHLAPQLAGFARVMSFGCSCFEYRSLSAGRADFLVAPDPNVWDHAAGQLIFHEAGGFSAFTDGEAYSPIRDRGILVCASNEALWHRLLSHFQLV